MRSFQTEPFSRFLQLNAAIDPLPWQKSMENVTLRASINRENTRVTNKGSCHVELGSPGEAEWQT